MICRELRVFLCYFLSLKLASVLSFYAFPSLVYFTKKDIEKRRKKSSLDMQFLTGKSEKFISQRTVLSSMDLQFLTGDTTRLFELFTFSFKTTLS